MEGCIKHPQIPFVTTISTIHYFLEHVSQGPQSVYRDNVPVPKNLDSHAVTISTIRYFLEHVSQGPRSVYRDNVPVPKNLDGHAATGEI